ncbi:SDR family NAD(P)-dependent oxidoreductase, partial [Agrobacterium tumefaciens]|uniref:SDR family NAD(P)-dependent oxidoreductase n=1 Tax=Agrobacterium tumefaciens TaxID=358 RepID=UPI003BA046BD
MSLSHDADRSPAQGVDLAGKIALVTGASRGIGRAIARQLAARGAILAVHYNQAQADADRLLDEIEGAGGDAFALAADLSLVAGAEQLANALGNTLQ